MLNTATVTEPSFYPAFLKIIEEKGGSGLPELRYASRPDIQFEFLKRDWLLSVKIGETPQILKGAFLQYLRHKEESGIKHGLLIMLPESVRKTKATGADVEAVIRSHAATVLIDAGPVHDQYRNHTFPQILDLLKAEVTPLIEKGVVKHYPLDLVISLMRAQVLEVMDRLTLDEHDILRIVTDHELLTTLGRLSKEQAENAARFLASYIILSQILFLRLFAAVHPHVIVGTGPMTTFRLRQAFQNILEINYRPIYKIDVLDLVDDKYLRDTFDLIWGLEVERIRYELPGRLFHELMPSYIRKILAAFYTRPQAAELLSRLTISSSNATVFDLASGSGTILVAAYREKRRLHELEGMPGNPHKRYCEQEIFGADIMPFAVHLSSANLAAMDVPQTIHRTQIIQGDSIHLSPGRVYADSVQLALFVQPKTVKTTEGEDIPITLVPVDTVLMNPPFTKVERRIKDYVDMERFKNVAGGEVGLWGHYIFLANQFLLEGGIYGAVIPINVLRGKESAKVRDFLLSRWTPLYILKPVINYGFSEWSEYRDILFIAKKAKPEKGHRVKFCLVKQDLTALQENDIERIVGDVKSKHSFRSSDLDIDSHTLEEIIPHSINMMWFCGVSDFSHRDRIINFIKKFKGKLTNFPEKYFREGYRPVPKGVSDFMFVTRNSNPVRVREAFLQFTKDGSDAIAAQSKMGVTYIIERERLTPSLRTPVGLTRMDISQSYDYVANSKYHQLKRVQQACGYKEKLGAGFWRSVERELQEVSSEVVVTRRINPYSPNSHLNAFFSTTPISSSNQVNIIIETDTDIARAVCALLNSSLFYAYFFLLKEESTGRYIDVRFYDLYEMTLYPEKHLIKPLNRVFKKYASKEFPALKHQFDKSFDDRYREFWKKEKGGAAQIKMWTVIDKQVEPSEIRLEYDLDVCKAIGVAVSKKDLLDLYETIVKEMIMTKHLTKD